MPQSSLTSDPPPYGLDRDLRAVASQGVAPTLAAEPEPRSGAPLGTSFAVVIPAMGTASLPELRRAVVSALGQFEDDVEGSVIIVSDRDRHAAIVRQFAGWAHLVIVGARDQLPVGHARNVGVAAARALGLTHAIFLDDDDSLCVGALRRLRPSILRGSVVAANSIRTSPDGAPLYWIDTSAIGALRDETLGTLDDPSLHLVYVGHPVLVEIEFMSWFGGFDPSLRCGEITEFVSRLSMHRLPMQFVDEHLYNYAIRSNSLSVKRRAELEHNRVNAIAKLARTIERDREVRIERRGRLMISRMPRFAVTVDGVAYVPSWLDQEVTESVS